MSLKSSVKSYAEKKEFPEFILETGLVSASANVFQQSVSCFWTCER